MKRLKTGKNSLETRKVEFITARRVAEDARAVAGARAGARAGPTPVVKLKPTSLPKFSGNMRDFYRWRKDWESLQKQGEPTGSAEVKKIQLLDSMDDKVTKDLRLSTYNGAEDIFRVLENRYGNRTTIAISIVEELERIPPVRGNQSRKVIDLIQSVEKALADLVDLGNTGAIKNPLMIKSIESKLPDFVKRDWLIFMFDPSNGVEEDNHFDALLKFLKRQEEILEKLEQLRVTDRPENKFEKYASTRATKTSTSENGCAVCGDERHKDKIFFCKKFRGLELSEKRAAVKKTGACKKCLGCHEDYGKCMDNYLCSNKNCGRGGSSDHHYFLCPKGKSEGEMRRL